jgi:hypothetical protein
MGEFGLARQREQSPYPGGDDHGCEYLSFVAILGLLTGYAMKLFSRTTCGRVVHGEREQDWVPYFSGSIMIRRTSLF